MGRKTQWDSAI